MIKFDGYISGSAETRFLKQYRRYNRNCVIIAVLILMPGTVLWALIMNSRAILNAYLAGMILFPLVPCAPLNRKEIKERVPNKVFVVDNYITSITDKIKETRKLDDVKCVRDFGEFYEFVFPPFKLSARFVCQKNLLSEGSIDEFEAIFKDKIVRMV